MKFVSQEVWKRTKDDGQKWLDWGKDRFNEGHSQLGGIGGFIKALVGYYAPGFGVILGWLFHFIAAFAIIALFLTLKFIFCVIGVIITSFLMLFLTVGNYLYSQFYKIYNVCPTCHHEMEIPTYICPNCSTEHTRLRPSVYGIRKHICKGTLPNNGGVCNHELKTLTYFGEDKLLSKICPECKRPIEGIGGINAHIPIVGLPNSGKTHYMYMGLKQLKEEYAPAHSLEVKLPNQTHLQQYEDSINSLKTGQTLLKNSAADDSAKALNLEVKKSNQAVPNLLYLYDVAGEYINADELAELQKYFEYVNGAFLIIDPFSIPQVHQKYEEERQDNASPSLQDLEASYERMLYLFETKTKKKRDKFSQPIAIIITKVDSCDLEQQIGTLAAQQYMAKNSDVNNEQDAINILVKQFLDDYGAGNLVRNIEGNFSDVRFFSCSNLGFSDQTIGSQDPHPSFDGVRVLEPMLWLMEQTDTLPHKASFVWQFLRSTTWIKYGLPIFTSTVMAGLLFGSYSLARFSFNLFQKPNSLPENNNIQSLKKGETLTEERLKNMEYIFYDEVYQLTDGKSFRPYLHSVGGVSVEIKQIAFGDINNNGLEDAAIFLSWNGDSSKVLNQLIVVLNENGTLRQTNTAPIGSRSIIEKFEIKDNQINIEMMTYSSEDSDCCPSLKTRKVFELKGDDLVLFSSLKHSSKPRPLSNPSSSESKISQQDAVNLINRWLQAKQTMFAPPYDRQLAAEITTGKKYKETAGYNGSIDWLQNNNTRYKYGYQNIDKVEKIVSNGNQANIQVKVTEKQTLYINGQVDLQNTKTGTISVIYYLKLIDGNLKIENSQIV
ncbi:Serine/Threonine protein kinase [Crocosphaera watsonii WH 0401]|uniref:Serine/Threonine protein kinase n=2 Tax=Crocosphaera watsonii TaxID=263511 RepID=T2JCU8_CROWT|nr:Serine/Threonine protein kinase [Crocosphaera watsonii WH 0401]